MIAASGAPIIEVKRHLDGRVQRFACELVHRTPWLVVVRYRVEHPPWGPPEAAPLDSYGCFWRRRPYNCYHMVRPADGVEVVSRFDVVRDVRLGGVGALPGEVSYTDLLLDLRVEPGPPLRARWEDEHEVAAATAVGTLSGDDLARIARARRVLERGHRRVIGELRDLLRELGRLPPP